MITPATALFTTLALLGASPKLQGPLQADSLEAYRTALGQAVHRTSTETTQDVAARLRSVVAPVAYDSIHAVLLRKATRSAQTEARYYRYIGAEPTTCPYGVNGYGCGDPDRRLNTEATMLRYQWRVARDDFNRTWLAVLKRLQADLAAEGAHRAA